MGIVGQVLRVIALWAVVLASGGANANIDAMSNNMFANVLTNYTPSGAYETQAQGIIAGPSYYARIKNSNIQLMNLSLPRIKADCNGIDAWGGSFSFISSEQLVNFLRAVAAQAVPFAFKLALDALCPSCEKYMQKLQDIANYVNGLNFNSCDATKKLFSMAGLMNPNSGGASQALKDAVAPVSAVVESALGSVPDFFSGYRSNDQATEVRLAQNFPAQAKDLVKGNIAWKILTNSALTTWWGTVYSASDDISLRELIMAYTGTIVKTIGAGQAVGGAPEADAAMVVRTIAPTISSMEELLNGGTVTVLRCDTTGDGDACLYPSPQNVTITGFRAIVRQTIDGILPKLTETGSSSLTNAERSFLENAPGSIGTHLVRLSTNPAAAYAYASMVSDYVGTELAAQTVDEILQAATIASQGELRDEAVGAYLVMLQQRRQEQYAAFEKQMGRLTAFEKTMTVSNLIRERLSAAYGVGVPFTR